MASTSAPPRGGTTPEGAPDGTPTPAGDTPPRWTRRLRGRFQTPAHRALLAAKIALVVNVGIMISGALVRVTGSGLGCSNWPKCQTRVLPSEAHTPTFIEFGNRMLTWVVVAAVAFAIFSMLTREVYRRDLTRLSVLLLGGVFMQAVIGGMSVLYDLDWIWISAHYMASIGLLIVPAVVLVWRAGDGAGVNRVHDAPGRSVSRAVSALPIVGFVALFAGTLSSAAGPNGGGEGTGDVVKRFDIHGEGTLEWIVQRHGALAAIFGIAVVAAWAYARTRGSGDRLSLVLVGAGMLIGLQGVLGLVQYGLELPAGLVWVHVILATLTWVTVVWAWQVAGSPKRHAVAEASGASSPATA